MQRLSPGRARDNPVMDIVPNKSLSVCPERRALSVDAGFGGVQSVSFSPSGDKVASWMLVLRRNNRFRGRLCSGLVRPYFLAPGPGAPDREYA